MLTVLSEEKKSLYKKVRLIDLLDAPGCLEKSGEGP